MKHHLFENEVTPDGADTGGTGEGADRPAWLPDNFKDAEAFRKSYDEQRKEMDRLRTSSDEERAQFAAALERVNETQQQQFQPQPGMDPQTQADLNAYQAAVESGDAAAQLAITLSLNQRMLGPMLDARFNELKPTLDTQSHNDRTMAFELAQERVGKQYGDDWKDLQPEVQAWLVEHQSWLPTVNDPNAFEAVIREGAQTVVNAKKAELLAAFESDRAAKLSAQGATGAGQGRYPTTGDDKKQAWDEVVGADVGSYDRMRGAKT